MAKMLKSEVLGFINLFVKFKPFSYIIVAFFAFVIGFIGYLRHGMISGYLAIPFFALGLTILIQLIILPRFIGVASRCKWVTFLPFIVFFLAFLIISLLRHFSFNSHAFDLGLYNQAFYQFSHLDFSNTIRKLPNLWGDHFTPIFLLLSQVFWIFPFSTTSLVIQALIVVSGGVPLFLLSKDVLKSRAAAIFLTTAYLASAGLSFAIQFDFHFITISTAFFLLTFYFAYKKRWSWYFISLLLLLSCKEDISIIVVFIGIFLLFWKNYKIGILTSLIGIAWFVMVSKVITPSLSTEGFVYFSYTVLGPTPAIAIKNFFLNPLNPITGLINSIEKQRTVLAYLTSWSFAPFLAPLFFLISIPAMGENLWNDNPSRWAGFHYGAFSSAVFAVTAVFAISYVCKYFENSNKRNVAIFLSLLCLISTIMVNIHIKSPLTSIVKKSTHAISKEDLDTYKVFSSIDKNASVTAGHSIVPHLAARKEIYEYPNCKLNVCGNSDYFVLSLAGSTWPLSQTDMKKEIVSFLNNESFRQYYGLYRNEGVAFVFKRNYKPDPNVVNRAINFLNSYQTSDN